MKEKNRGYGRETITALTKYAFEELKMNKVWFEAYPDNQVGRHLYESMKFHVDGVLRQHHKTPRGILDQIQYSMLKGEYEELKVCRDFLFATRYALHVTINREDNRLTLDTQKNVARLLGYGDEGNLPVEKMMRAFFRVVRRVRELNSMTLQLETLRITGHLGDNDEPQFLSSYFVRRGALIDVTDPDLFLNEPWRMLEIFHEISRHPDILGRSRCPVLQGEDRACEHRWNPAFTVRNSTRGHEQG